MLPIHLECGNDVARKLGQLVQAHHLVGHTIQDINHIVSHHGHFVTPIRDDLELMGSSYCHVCFGPQFAFHLHIRQIIMGRLITVSASVRNFKDISTNPTHCIRLNVSV